MRLSVPLKDRLAIRSVRVGECIEWTGYVNYFGYGKLTYQNRQEYAHRAAWIANGGVIPDGMFICHKCDNRRCINPDHLFVGSQKDNMQDMKAKCRRRNVGGARGSAHPSAKVNEAQVLEIRASNLTPEEIAARFNISKKHVYQILNRLTWKHI